MVTLLKDYELVEGCAICASADREAIDAELDLDAARGMVEEILIEGQTGVPVPPGGVKDDLHGQRAVGQGFRRAAVHGAGIVWGKRDRVNRTGYDLGASTNGDDRTSRSSTEHVAAPSSGADSLKKPNIYPVARPALWHDFRLIAGERRTSCPKQF